MGTEKLVDPTLVIYSNGETELGVSTEYGVVFLGKHAQGGEVDLSAWFGDGPSLESTVIEPIGGGLYTAEADIRLPSVPLVFHQPAHREIVTVLGRAGTSAWSEEAEVRRDPRVDGILLRPSGRLTGAPDQLGAGVYVGEEIQDYRLLGLVSGRIRITGSNGASIDYITVIGPQDLWRLVSHRRDHSHKRRWVYREDVL